MFGAFRAERGSDVGINKDIKNSKLKRDQQRIYKLKKKEKNEEKLTKPQRNIQYYLVQQYICNDFGSRGERSRENIQNMLFN